MVRVYLRNVSVVGGYSVAWGNIRSWRGDIKKQSEVEGAHS